MKRVFDIILSIVMCLSLWPLILLVGVLVRVKLGSPVLFSQMRPGKNGKLFKLYKFRSMTSETDSSGQLLPDHVRLTKFGSLLRSTSLDELPALWNVLVGEMSLVGPRPLLVEYLTLYSPEQSRRHEVRPGISGWAQVNGRNALSWEKKFELDVWYVDNHSVRLDIRILLLTVKKVFIREGISGDNSVTMEKFKGRSE